MDASAGRMRWPIGLTVPPPSNLAEVLDALRSPGAVRWYTRAGVSLVWLVLPGQALVQAASGPVSLTIGVILLAVYATVFLLAVPVSWSLPARARLIGAGALFALSFALMPWLGWQISGVWTYAGVTLAMAALPWRLTWTLLAVLGAVTTLFQGFGLGWSMNVLWLPAIVVSISFMMAGFAQTQAALNRLRASQLQVEQLAVERERGRVARDMHDILGHSLTVITVKSELAGRLIDADPDRARRELAEIEQLARGALADVRATVAGVRAVTVSAELAAARSALGAAGITAQLPSSTDAIGPAHRELAGWVVREGVTNVLRHSGASVCRVRLDAHELEVADDGVGPREPSAGASGLAGLRERVEAGGGRMSVGRSELGGFSLRVAL